MSQDRWEAVDFKLGEAYFVLCEMHKDLTPSHDSSAVYLTATGALPTKLWQPQFYYHVDAFLAATRSIPDIIQAWFGLDSRAKERNPREPWKSWLTRLHLGEQPRRAEFRDQFCHQYTAFAQLPLSQVRNATFHSRGLPSVEVVVTDRWGIVYRGSPSQSIPIADQRPEPTEDDPAKIVPLITSPTIPLTPSLNDFLLSIPGTAQPYPLFQTCWEYLQAGQGLREKAHEIAKRVHQGQSLTCPPL